MTSSRRASSQNLPHGAAPCRALSPSDHLATATTVGIAAHSVVRVGLQLLIDHDNKFRMIRDFDSQLFSRASVLPPTRSSRISTPVPDPYAVHGEQRETSYGIGCDANIKSSIAASNERRSHRDRPRRREASRPAWASRRRRPPNVERTATTAERVQPKWSLHTPRRIRTHTLSPAVTLAYFSDTPRAPSTRSPHTCSAPTPSRAASTRRRDDYTRPASTSRSRACPRPYSNYPGLHDGRRVARQGVVHPRDVDSGCPRGGCAPSRAT